MPAIAFAKEGNAVRVRGYTPDIAKLPACSDRH
jgi:hypothetical protein